MRALFVDLPAPLVGRRFALLHEAQGEPRGSILYVHPLAEEMNKSRRMAAEQARRLAAAGWTVLQWDLLGCGDSDGDFADADWALWRAELVHAAQWLREQAAGPQWLWGLRAGALLAAEVAAALPHAVGLLCWQASNSGKLVAQQFLRLRVAAELISGQAKGVMQTLRAELAAGQTVDLGGYGVRAPLIDGLERATLAPVVGVLGLIWLELADGGQLAPASLRTLEAWRAAGVPVQQAVLTGPPFWQTTEIEDAPVLWEATARCLAAHPESPTWT